MALTELEGAVLSEIHHRDNHSAFRVRRAFQTSPSTEWSGSSGAVYPAIRRLTERGLVDAELLQTARRASRLTLTPEGERALDEWATDVGRAIGVGLDPFRLRSGIWAGLPSDRQTELLTRLLEAIDAERDLEGTHQLDETERPRAEWATILQDARRAWLVGQLELLAKEAGHAERRNKAGQHGRLARCDGSDEHGAH